MIWWFRGADNSSWNNRLVEISYHIGKNLEFGRLEIITPDGGSRQFTGNVDGPDATLKLNSLHALRRFAVGGSLGFAEAYLDGDWDSPTSLAFSNSWCSIKTPIASISMAVRGFDGWRGCVIFFARIQKGAVGKIFSPITTWGTLSISSGSIRA